jgi:nucleoside-diphosphate-sugar epimerase
MHKLVILGCGFVGKHLVHYLNDEYDIYTTSRNPENNLNTLPNPVLFDLNNSNTYKNIPQNSIIIWNFPAQPIEKVKEFYNFTLENNISIKIIYGSTSAYISKEGLIDETNLTDESIGRVNGENFLLRNGVNILQLSGIYGESRHPFNWLNKGLIKNSNKTVNLIHVDDICKITKKILNINIKGERINLSDGVNYLWKDLWALGFDKNIVHTECPVFLEADHRHISNKKILNLIGSYSFNTLK